jgi:hypothetical protein
MDGIKNSKEAADNIENRKLQWSVVSSTFSNW